MHSLYPTGALIAGIIFLALVPPVGLILILVAVLGGGGDIMRGRSSRREAQQRAYARAYDRAEQEWLRGIDELARIR